MCVCFHSPCCTQFDVSVVVVVAVKCMRCYFCVLSSAALVALLLFRPNEGEIVTYATMLLLCIMALNVNIMFLYNKFTDQLARTIK